MQHPNIRVRFAPSPTGHLHVGGLRSAYFNWLFARHVGGKFLIRIEDTDPERSKEEYVQSQLASLKWCGLESDEPLVIQSHRLAEYQKIAHQMVDAGQAYRCYCSPQELETRLGANAAEGTGYSRYDGKCRNNPQNTQIPPILSGVEGCSGEQPYAIRFKLSQDIQEVVVNDLIRGTITFSRDILDDFIILRSDSYPMYNFSVVIDDALMRISHVIRGEEHLVNTPRQLLIYRALGYTAPQFAHLPLILGADGTKLSKRDAAVSVIEYKKMGYLPEALSNYLVRLGWSHGDQEIFTQEELIQLFTLEGVGKKGSIFDLTKLTWMNGVFLHKKSAQELMTRIADIDGAWHHELARWSYEQVLAFVELYKERAETLRQLMHKITELYHEPVQYELKPSELSETQKSALEVLSARFAALSWDRTAIEQTIKAVCHEFQLKLSQVAPPLRVALTGTMSSPAIYDIVYLLGKETVLQRIKRYGAFNG